jgi:hypothetical protein
VRRSSGEQASAINLIIDSLNQDRIRLAHPQRRLRELLGHKPLEVTMGALIGFLLACLFNIDKLHKVFEFFATPVSIGVTVVLAVIGVLMLAYATFGRWLLLRRYRKIDVIAAVVRRTAWAAWVLGAIGLLLAFVQYEKVAASLWLIWPSLYVIAVILSVFRMMWPSRNAIPAAIAENRAELDKSKWFEGPNKERRAKKARAKKRR